jgi:hypothetical protein
MYDRIKIELEASLLRRLARKQKLSVSAFLKAQIEHMIRERKSYDSARERALARLRKGMDLGWIAPNTRGELYER